MRTIKVTIEKETRLNKYLADIGVASRRGADKMIEENKVTVNNNIHQQQNQQITGTNVNTNLDELLCGKNKFEILDEPEMNLSDIEEPIEASIEETNNFLDSKTVSVFFNNTISTVKNDDTNNNPIIKTRNLSIAIEDMIEIDNIQQPLNDNSIKNTFETLLDKIPISNSKNKISSSSKSTKEPIKKKSPKILIQSNNTNTNINTNINTNTNKIYEIEAISDNSFGELIIKTLKKQNRLKYISNIIIFNSFFFIYIYGKGYR